MLLSTYSNMASVRSMLRSERANRRIIHPHLTYSTTGTLTCQVCHIQIKTEALWNKHLGSAQHSSNLQRLHETTSIAPTLVEDTYRGNGSKKRKADDDSSDDETRKRTRGQDPTDLSEDDGQAVSLTDRTQWDPKPTNDKKRKLSTEPEEVPSEAPIDPDPKPNGVPPDLPSQPPSQPNPIDEDEWAAFQRELASPPPETSALTAAADISAAPMTAAELAAQSRQQASRQAKERLEAEVEGEKEDAARQMEEEFEEMAELEDRVRRLREKREQLRVNRAKGGGEVAHDDEEKVPPGGIISNGHVSDDDASDGEEDEWGGWGR
ncbi:MAG: hypothetical protein Q9186_002101 [Xanthomendoza sp. 1 TL-2023]